MNPPPSKTGLVPSKAGFIPRAAGFTLVEMLVVIVILGILMAMMVPAAGLILKRAQVARAKSDAGVVVTAMLKYNAEYNRWPSNYAEDTRDTTDMDWVAMMAPPTDLAVASPENFKRITFFEPGGGALATGAFVDAWGKPYKYRVDRDGNGQINNPDDTVGGQIRARALAWSGGPDGNTTTWADNATSWE